MDTAHRQLSHCEAGRESGLRENVSNTSDQQESTHGTALPCCEALKFVGKIPFAH